MSKIRGQAPSSGRERDHADEHAHREHDARDHGRAPQHLLGRREGGAGPRPSPRPGSRPRRGRARPAAGRGRRRADVLRASRTGSPIASAAVAQRTGMPARYAPRHHRDLPLSRQLPRLHMTARQPSLAAQSKVSTRSAIDAHLASGRHVENSSLSRALQVPCAVKATSAQAAEEFRAHTVAPLEGSARCCGTRPAGANGSLRDGQVGFDQ